MTKNLKMAVGCAIGMTLGQVVAQWNPLVSIMFPVNFVITWGVFEAVEWFLAPKPKAEQAPETKPMSDVDRHRAAVHEAGHGILSGAVGPWIRVLSLPAVRCGRLRGHMAMIAEDEVAHVTRSGYRDAIAVFFGGRVAEEIVLGEAGNGCGNDLRSAAVIVNQMLMDFGMGEGDLAYLQLDANEDISNEMLVVLETAKRTEIQAQAARAKSILEANRELLDEITEKLLEIGMLQGAALDLLLVRVQKPF